MSPTHQPILSSPRKCVGIRRFVRIGARNVWEDGEEQAISRALEGAQNSHDCANGSCVFIDGGAGNSHTCWSIPHSQCLLLVVLWYATTLTRLPPRLSMVSIWVLFAAGIPQGTEPTCPQLQPTPQVCATDV